MGCPACCATHCSLPCCVAAMLTDNLQPNSTQHTAGSGPLGQSSLVQLGFACHPSYTTHIRDTRLFVALPLCTSQSNTHVTLCACACVCAQVVRRCSPVWMRQSVCQALAGVSAPRRAWPTSQGRAMHCCSTGMWVGCPDRQTGRQAGRQAQYCSSLQFEPTSVPSCIHSRNSTEDILTAQLTDAGRPCRQSVCCTTDT